MRKVLIYIEPHPIRNYYEEFHDVGLLLCKSMLRGGEDDGYEFRFTANDYVADRIIADNPGLSFLLNRFSAAESAQLAKFYGQWGKETIAQWIQLVRGEGEVSDFYQGVLARIYKEFQFDVVLLWSDNGAVRNFCQDVGVLVLHAEYGPTRPPFQKTIYFDPAGTNGAAAVLQAPISDIVLQNKVPAQTWMARQGMEWNDLTVPGLVDVGWTIQDTDEVDSFPRPYIFIPLQLEDDLNTQLYSKYRTPESFLRKIIPEILNAGLDVVIKGHPAAASRPYNLVAETKAIAYATSLGDRVHILPRRATAFRTIKVITQSVGVATINSSVGYEALLMGKSVRLYGAAAFDVGGLLQAPKRFDPKKFTMRSPDKIDQLTSFLCGHYLHPVESVTEGDALFRVLDYIFLTRGKRLAAKEFWQGWVERIGSGWRWLARTPTEDGPSHRETGQLAGNRFIFEGVSRSLVFDRDKVHVKGKHKHRYVTAFADLGPQRFIGFIDAIEEPGSDAQAHFKISGWFLEKDSLRPPIQLLLCRGNEVISNHRIVAIRTDVADVLKKPITPRCGFVFQINKAVVSNPEECSLLLISASNNAQLVRLAVGCIHGDNNNTQLGG